MNILIISTEYPPYLFGGGGTFAHTLATSLASKGHRVIVVSRGPETRHEEGEGVRILRVRSPEIKPRHFWFQVRSAPIVKRLLDRGLVDVVHANSFSGGIIFQFLKNTVGEKPPPMIVTVHGYPRHYLHISLHSAKLRASMGEIATYLASYPSWDALLAKEVHTANAVVPVAKFLAEDIVRDYKADPSKVYHIPNSVDTDYIERSTRRCQYDFGECDVAAGGRFFYTKGLHLIPLVAKHLARNGSKTRFCVFGEGPYRVIAEQLARRLGVHSMVEFLGRLPRQEALCVMKHSKLLFLPSLYEIMPVTLLEAAALGKPIVALRAPYSIELAEAGFNIMLASTIREAASIIARVLAGEDYKKAAIENKRLVSEKYSASRMAESYLNLYRRLKEGH